MHDKNKHDDDDLIYFFKNFESILGAGNPTVNSISSAVDFTVFRDYFVQDIKQIKDGLSGADDTYLLQTAEHTYSIIAWMRLIVDNRGEAFSKAFEDTFNKEFGDSKILETLYTECLVKWLSGKKGQYKIGKNTYSTHSGSIYYRDRFERWFEVKKEEVFNIQPAKTIVEDSKILSLLKNSYQPTEIDLIINEWEDQNLDAILPVDFLQFNQEKTTPEEYFTFSIAHLKSLAENPISIAELERWNGGTIVDLEETITVCTSILEYVKNRRNYQSHTIYLLRDSLLFYEAHKIFDIIESKETSSDQLLIGRKMLSHQPNKWGYYIVILEALYEAHKRYPSNYSEFYNEFGRLMDVLVSVNPKFQALIERLLPYIQNHLHTDKHRVTIFDVGFQGSINLFINHIIDRYISPNAEYPIETDIEIAVGALWSKELFGERFKSDFFPFLDQVQRMATSDELYHYEFNGLNDTQVTVTMGNKNWQKKAAIERAVLVMLARLG